jgi:glycosyltransferase involved in cell wall biosynthesis
LNIMPVFPRGAHDRIFSAMLNSSISVSDTNDYIASLFEDGRDGVFFRWSDLDRVPDRLADLLADPDRIDAIAAHGRQLCVGQHDWADRARRLLKIVEVHRIMHSLTHPSS